MKLVNILSILLLSLSLSSCSHAADNYMEDNNVVYAPGEEEYASQVAVGTQEMKTYSSSEENLNVEVNQTVERKLTKNGSIRFKTRNMDKSKQEIVAAVKELKGYISNDKVSEYGNDLVNRMIIRIPSEGTDEFLAQLEKIADKIESKNISVNDVTEQFIDLQARIKTKKEVEARYIELLNKANNVSEVLQIEQEIGNIRTTIESAEGRLQYLTNQVAFSTIEVEFYISSPQAGFWKKMGNAFKNGWDGFLTLLIGIVNLWAVILFVVLVIWIVRRIIVRRRRKRRQKRMD